MRVKSLDDLGDMGVGVRRQVEKAMNDGTDTLGGFRKQLGEVVQENGRLRRAYPEEEAGRELIRWIDQVRMIRAQQNVIVGDYFAHNANGGARTATEGAILVGQGVRAGWPDYTLYIPHQGFAGLVMEIKADDGSKPDAEQLEILLRLERMGYCARVAWGADMSKQSVRDYLVGTELIEPLGVY